MIEKPAGSPTPLVLRGRRFDASAPAVMAILNLTPDSFFRENRFHDLDAAVAALDEAVRSGADIVDVGAVRAGQEGEEVDADREIARLAPFLEVLRERHPDVLVSLDTWRGEVATAVGHLGIDLVNDTWAGHDPALVEVAAGIGAGYVVSHAGGLAPRTDPVGVSYGARVSDVLPDVLSTLTAGARRAVEAGVAPEAVLVDPTLDFGKTTRHSLYLLRHTDAIAAIDHPVLMALSRKDFIGETLDVPAEERLEGSLAATAVAAWLGATVFRTHDVVATRRTVDMVASIRGERAPAISVRGEPEMRDPD